MKYIYGSLLFIWIIVEAVEKSKSYVIGTGLILIALCLFVIKEKFLDNAIYTFIYAVAIVSLTSYNNILIILLGIVLVDFAYFKKYYLLGIFAFIAIMLCYKMGQYNYIFHIYTGAVWGYAIRKSDDRDKKYIGLLDNERGYRYQLEKTQIELVRLQNEIEHTTEVRERNRIAQEIHDSVGHSIAGVLFQLRAAEKILTTNSQKVEQMLKLCIDKLAEALQTTRKTVYNIKSDQITGIACIENIIKEFKFCNLEFIHNGDFNTISTLNLKTIESTTKELLTNAIKHSGATEIILKIDINNKVIRYFYRDNGRGCEKMKENIGLSSIRDRVKNVGGTYSVDGNNGFTVVCTYPNKQEV